MADNYNLTYWYAHCLNYIYINENEKIAAKEGTTGKIYSFKMIEEK